MEDNNEFLLLSVGRPDLTAEEFHELSEHLSRVTDDMGIEQPVVLLNQPVETVSADELRELLEDTVDE